MSNIILSSQKYNQIKKSPEFMSNIILSSQKYNQIKKSPDNAWCFLTAYRVPQLAKIRAFN